MNRRHAEGNSVRNKKKGNGMESPRTGKEGKTQNDLVAYEGSEVEFSQKDMKLVKAMMF